MTSPSALSLSTASRRHRGFSGSPSGTLLLYGVIVVLLFGPLAFGAVEAWSSSIIEVGAALLFLLWAVRQVLSGKLEIVTSPLFLPALVFGSLIVWQLLNAQTAYRAATISTALLYCAYGLLSFLVLQSLRETAQVKMLGLAMSAYGFAIATFALLQGISSNGKLYWLRPAQTGGWIYGPYVNHNHYAGLMEILTPIPLVISLMSHVRNSRRALAGLAAAVMATTIFLSGSRGGMIAFAVQTFLLATFLVKRRRGWKAALSLGGFVILALAMLTWLGGSELADRITSIDAATLTELSGGTRLAIDRDALRMIAQKPLLGWGLGAFPEVYPQFSSFSSNLAIGMAHNDYLQILVEMGALGFATVLWFLVALYRAALKKINRRPSDINSSVTLMSLLGVTGILVHSFVDFNLQIPANAALFYALCAAATGNCQLEHRHHGHGDHSHASVDSSHESIQVVTASTG